MDDREVEPNQVYDSNQPIAPYRRVPTHCRYLSDDRIRHIRRFNTLLNDFKEAMLTRAHFAKLTRTVMSWEFHDRLFGRNSTFDMEERKTFISSRRMYSWHEKLYGIMRVAVYEMDTICVVTRKKDFERLEEDMVRARDGAYWPSVSLPEALIAEVEDLECLSGESRYRHNKRIQEPFGVVSMIPGKKRAHRVRGHEGSSAEYGEEKAIKFLQEAMNRTTTFTTLETIKTAVCALQHLFRRRFKPDQIQVIIRKRDGHTVEVLNVREEPSIKDVLSVINDEYPGIKDILSVLNKQHSAADSGS